MFVYYTGQNIVGLVLVGSGSIVIAVICHFSIKYFYGTKKIAKKKKNNRHPIIFDRKIFHYFNFLASKRSPVNEDLEEVRKVMKAQQEADEARMTEADRQRYIEEREFELKLMEKF